MSQAARTLRIRPISYLIIPARLASTRLPRKLLLRETGKSVLQHTYEAASRATRPTGICVATDHEEIARDVQSFGGQVQMTDPAAASGTDRIAEVAARLENVDIVVNVQGDEPEITGESIDQVVGLLEDHPSVPMATLGTPITAVEQLNDPACVKVVFDQQGKALYFSRSRIPHPRDDINSWLAANPPVFFQHLGIYAYRRDFLLKIAQMPQSVLEQVEKLEQLRILNAGHTILVGVTNEPTLGIDTIADYQAFVSRIRHG